ncbi:chemotaxis protein CheA [Pontibacillus yanchengensis]|uniref:Chemotaxis protein CheA n=2 Tax=Pontibacillus yanchengensis TaxID=462910 RepID=A0ACC7VB89_9BACI|nr:chemotaxis protein CheA [Pontibacillus yanchengensis]MYL33163.1 chemotaxis protein CheA [Pontibacillus yanchengensis]MYL51987.1 chemotaxis protein CheA [Pontibacillus yanchengensis]
MEMSQYLEVFIEESKEHLQTVNDSLLALEKNPQDLSIVNEIFRAAHTLKGMSATMGYQDLANLTHIMENVLDAVRNHQIEVDSNILDIVFDAVDDLEAMVTDISAGGSGERNVEVVVEKLKRIEQGEKPADVQHSNVDVTSQHNISVDEENASLPDTISDLDEFELTVLQESDERGFTNFQILVELREDCLLKAARVYMVFEVLEQIGEVIKSNPAVDQLEEENFDHTFSILIVSEESNEEIKNRIEKVSEIESVDVKEFSINQYQNNSQSNGQDFKSEQEVVPSDSEKELETTTSSVATMTPPQEKTEEPSTTKQQTSQNKTIRVNIERLDVLMNLFEELVIDRGRLEQISNDLDHTELEETVERMSRISGDLQNIILNMRMVPVEQVFNRFPRMVRQLARDLNKKVNLDISGAETELDRTVIDEIGDPLVHLIRNSLDHGIESPDHRVQQGKTDEGTLSLEAYHSGNHVFIEVSDDGGGINRDKVLDKAISNGVITQEQAKGLSNQQVFDLIMESGFSTADKVSDVSGRGVGLDVVKNTIESLGGTITIDSKLGEGSVFSIQLPLTLSIISVMLVEVQQEKYAIPLSSIIETAIVKKDDIMHAHNKKVIDFRGRVVPLVFLKDVLDVPVEEEEDYYSVVLVRKGDKTAGLVVDSFIGQQEVVLKSLGNYLTNVFAISGATILGDGQVALILDSNALIK